MSKQRPSESGGMPIGLPTARCAQKTTAYWRRRIYKNSYTRNGQRFVVRGWSVKIQHGGRRMTISLRSSSQVEAAMEAQMLHRKILGQGWKSVEGGGNDQQPEAPSRDLTVAFRWADNPVVWTYATIRTQAGSRVPGRARPLEAAVVANVAIVECERGLRHALAASVNRQKGFSSEISFSTAQEAQRELPRRRVHLVLINQNLLDPAGATLRALLRQAPGTAYLVYSVHADSDVLFKSTPSGAMGYLLKRTAPHQILDPLAGDWEGGTLTREAVAQCVQRYFRGLLSSWVRGGTIQAFAKLTWREREILALLSQGNLDKHIAEELRISIWTVHGHLKNIYEKMGVHSRTEAVVKYLQK